MDSCTRHVALTAHSNDAAAATAHEDDDDISTTLLSPLSLNPSLHLSHRVVLAPVTRCRALNYVPQPAHIEFYSERASPGGLLITEAVAVSQAGIGFPHSPGIWSSEQVEAWSKVVTAVHRKGGIIFCQLWHVGRASHTYYQPNGCDPVSPTSQKVPSGYAIRLPDGMMAEYSQPRALDIHEIPLIVTEFAQAAANAREAGFDGVEIHGAHGYLIDQFFKDSINDRSDDYGGSIENRCRFGMEVVEAVASEMGEERTSLRVSPVIDHLGADDTNPNGLFLHLISRLNRKRLAYLHITEPRFNNKGDKGVMATQENCLLFTEAYEGVVMLSGGFTRETGMEAVRSGATNLVSYGRLFISNPDLPLRFAMNAKLNEYDRSTFYTHDQYVGYLDYPKLSIKDMNIQECYKWKKLAASNSVFSTRSCRCHRTKRQTQPISSTRSCGSFFASVSQASLAFFFFSPTEGRRYHWGLNLGPLLTHPFTLTTRPSPIWYSGLSSFICISGVTPSSAGLPILGELLASLLLINQQVLINLSSPKVLTMEEERSSCFDIIFQSPLHLNSVT